MECLFVFDVALGSEFVVGLSEGAPLINLGFIKLRLLNVVLWRGGAWLRLEGAALGVAEAPALLEGVFLLLYLVKGCVDACCCCHSKAFVSRETYWRHTIPHRVSRLMIRTNISL